MRKLSLLEVVAFIIAIVIFVGLSVNTQKAYDKCMIENNNDVDFCSVLKK